MENMTIAIRNKMALKYGLIIGIIYLLLFTGINVLVGNYVMYLGMRCVGYILYMVLIGVFATQIKNANGGFMEFKEVFSVAFIMVLVAGIIYYIYTCVYFLYIDPHFMDKMKASTLVFMEKVGAPDDAIEKSMKKFDEEIASSKTLNIGNTLLYFLGFVIMDSLFAMVVCLIVKKTKPMF